MSESFLTTARLALLARLQADETLAANVRTWFDWGPGLKKRFNIEPATCPLVTVVPAELSSDLAANVVSAIPQDIEIGIATAGQDAAPSELLAAAVLDVVAAANADCLAMSGDGVHGLDVLRVDWQAAESTKAANYRWEVSITIRINWRRLAA